MSRWYAPGVRVLRQPQGQRATVLASFKRGEPGGLGWGRWWYRVRFDNGRKRNVCGDELEPLDG